MVRKPEQRWLDRLQSMDRHLFISWDPVQNRWIICRADPIEKEHGNPVIYRVMTVEKKDGSFCEMDEHFIQELRRLDLQRYSNAKEATNATLKQSRAAQRELERRSNDKLEGTAEYYARAIQRAVAAL